MDQPIIPGLAVSGVAAISLGHDELNRTVRTQVEEFTSSALAVSCLILSMKGIKRTCELITAVDTEEPITFAGLARQIRDGGSTRFRELPLSAARERSISWRIRGFEDFGAYLIRELPTLEEGRHEDLRGWNPARTPNFDDTVSFGVGVVMFTSAIIGTQASIHGVPTAELLEEYRREAFDEMIAEGTL